MFPIPFEHSIRRGDFNFNVICVAHKYFGAHTRYIWNITCFLSISLAFYLNSLFYLHSPELKQINSHSWIFKRSHTIVDPIERLKLHSGIKWICDRPSRIFSKPNHFGVRSAIRRFGINIWTTKTSIVGVAIIQRAVHISIVRRVEFIRWRDIRSPDP